MRAQFITIIILSITASLFAGLLPAGLYPFSIMAYSTVTSSGATVIGSATSTGDVGLYPGTSVTGFPPGIVNGALEVANTKSNLAQGDVTIAYGSIANTPCTTTLTDTELGGKTFGPGVYCSGAPVTLTGTISLDTQGKVGPVWIFQLSQTLTTASSSAVVFIGSPAPCNVFWNVGAGAILGSTTSMMGIINAHSSVSFGTGATLTGKAFAQTEGVTLLGNTLTQCTEQASGPSTCFGKASTDATVCGGNGSCVNTDSCVCKSGTAGKQCETCLTGWTRTGSSCVKNGGSNGAGAIVLGTLSAIVITVMAL